MMDHQVWSEKKRAGKMGENGGKKEQEASLRLKNRLSMSETETRNNRQLWLISNIEDDIFLMWSFHPHL